MVGVGMCGMVIWMGPGACEVEWAMRTGVGTGEGWSVMGSNRDRMQVG